MFRVDIEDFPIFFFVSEASFTRVYLNLNGSEEKVLGFRESNDVLEFLEMTYSSISIVHVYPPRSKALFPLTRMPFVHGAQVNGTLVLVSPSGSTGIKLIMSIFKGFFF